MRNGLAAVGDLKQIQTMKKFFILTAAALTVFAACSKEKDVVSGEKVPAGMVKASFYADIDQTKSTESGAVFSWTENEEVAVVAADDDTKLKFTCDNVSEGHFTGTIGEGKSFGFAISPYNAAGDMIELDGDVSYEIIFATEYNNYVPSTTNAIMVGTPSTSGKFMFRHAAAAFKFTVENVPVGTATISVTTDANITGTVSKDVLSGSGLEISNSDSGLDGKKVDLKLKDDVSTPNQTLTFYVPVPTGNYKALTVAFVDGNSNVLVSKEKTGLNINLSRGDVYYTPKMTFDAVTINKGAEWSYTFESSAFNGLGTETLSGQDWTLDGQATDSGYFGYDDTKGVQFGSGKKPFSTLSFTSNFGASYGISDVVINTSGASSIDAVISVSVGGTPFVTGTEPASTVSLTADATEYTFTTPDGNLKAGNVVISYVNSSEKAIYLKSIVINPDSRPDPELSFDPTSYNVLIGESFTAPTLSHASGFDGTVTYSIGTNDNPDVASVNASTGVVTIGTVAGSVTVTASFAGNDNWKPASASYTINVSSASATGWIETALADITSSDVFVIVGDNGDTYAMSNDGSTSTAPSAVSVTVSGTTLTGTIAENIKWTISGNATNGYIFYPNGSSSTWLYTTTGNNGLRVGSSAHNLILIDAQSGYMTIYDGSNTRYIGIYNSADWRSYTSIGSNIAGQTFKFYKYVSAPDNRDSAPISWSAATGTATWSSSGISSTLPSLTNNSNLAVTYSSDNLSVATVAADGTVTIVGVGEAEISATYDGSDNNAPYKTTKVVYTLTVTDNRTAVATPTFSPAAGEIEAGTVSISCATQGATIHYTTDSSTPTASSTIYSTPISVSAAVTIKAIAIKENYLDSDVATASYTIANAAESLPYSNTLLGSHTGFTFETVSDGGLSDIWTDTANYGIQANGYHCTSNVEAYAVSPLIDMTSAAGARLTFTHGINFFADVATAMTQATLEVRVKNGSWSAVTIPTYPSSLGNSAVETHVDLSSYVGNIVQFRFKYLATTTNPGRWQIKNLTLAEWTPPTLSSIAVSNPKTSFTVGDTFSFGSGTVTATYSDSSTADVTSSATFSGYNMSSEGNQTVTVSYTESGVTKTTTYGITVSSAQTKKDYYKLVTSVSDITAGTYVVGALRSSTATNNFYFGKASVSSGDWVVSDDYVTVAESNGERKFEIDDLPTGAVEFTFTGDNTNGFTISNGANYLYYTASSNRKLAFASAGSSRKWKFSAKSGALITGGVYISAVGGTYTISENSTAVGAIRGYANTTSYRAIYIFKKVNE